MIVLSEERFTEYRNVMDRVCREAFYCMMEEIRVKGGSRGFDARGWDSEVVPSVDMFNSLCEARSNFLSMVRKEKVPR